MKYNDFAIGRVLASSVGIVVTNMPGYVLPAERAEVQQLPGRSGGLRLRSREDGRRVWETVDYVITCALRPEADADAAMRFLRSAGQLLAGAVSATDRARLELGSVPGSAFDARLSSQIPLSAVHGMDWREYRTFTAVFTCQPYRYEADETEPFSVTQSDTTIENPYDCESLPLVLVEGSGDAVLTLGDKTVELTFPDDGVLLLDCDTEDVFSADRGELRNECMAGDFPCLPAGASTVLWTGNIESVTIRPRWRRV